MIRRDPKRMVRPGEWVLARVPRPEYTEGREVVLLGIAASREPDDRTRLGFQWYYRPVWRCPEAAKAGTYYTHKEYRDAEDQRYYRLQTWHLDLVDATWDNRVRFDVRTSGEWHKGNGGHLYQPASEDPDLCPGPDYSFHQCSLCNRYVEPWSREDGGLICPHCEARGLVMSAEVAEYLEEVREFARAIGRQSHLEHALTRFSDEWFGADCRTVLGKDFAPYSFTFAVYQLPKPGEADGRLVIHGGLIYQGPTSPADGSAPSFCVSLAEGIGWFTHT